MSNDLTNKPSAELDGFTGYTHEAEGDDRGGGGSGILRGHTRVKFLNAKWITHPEGRVLPPDLKLIAYDIARVVNKWGKDTSKGPLEERVLGPGEKYPDFKLLNEQAPREEWIRGPSGEMRGPYSGQRLVYMVDMKTMSRYVWTDPLTIGGSIAVANLVDQTELKRKAARDNRLFPEITLSDTFFPTRYGGRQRPHLPLTGEWISFGTGPTTPIAVEGPKGGQLSPAEEKATPPKEAKEEVIPPGTKETSVAKTAKGKPTAKEVVDDEIPFA
jgi:hypothetical protein